MTFESMEARTAGSELQPAKKDPNVILALLEAALETTTDGILVIDDRGEILAFNQRFARIWRLPPELGHRLDKKALQRHCQDLVVDPRSSAASSEELRVADGEESRHPVELKDGRVLERFTQVRRIGEKTMGRVVSYRDVTERREAQEHERRSRNLAEAMSQGILTFLQSGSINQMAQILLDRCRDITKAEFGILYDLDGNGDAGILAVSGQTAGSRAEKRPLREILAELQKKGASLRVPRSESFLFAPVRQERTILDNNPKATPGRAGMLPPYHPPLGPFLGTPLKIGREIVGMLGLMNRPGGFTGREKEELEAFARTVALAVQAARSELARQEATDYLRVVQKFEAIGQLAGGIAHDFNNLLTVINGYGTLLQKGLDKNHPHREGVEIILQAGERAANLVRQLLAFSRRQVLEPKVLNLNELIRNFEKILRRLLGEDIEVTFSLAEDLGRVRVDPSQFEQILINLVVNGRDAMKGGGRLTIRTRNADLDAQFVRTHQGSAAGRYALLEVVDTGTGMPEEVRSRVFEPFFTTKEQGKGTGLGLATVYGIVKQSGGYIWVESAPGQGAAFSIYLPLAGEEETAPKERQRPAEVAGGGTILVVEDEPDVLGLVAETLTVRGFQVLRAAAPEEALVLAGDHGGRIDLLLTDMVMPGMGGPKLSALLQEKRPQLKTLYMSGYAHGSKFTLGRGKAFLPKPFTPDTLAAKVREVLGMTDIHSPSGGEA